MCAQFRLKTLVRELMQIFRQSFTPKSDFIDERYMPYQWAPVVVWEKNNFAIRRMNFSLIPSWSKEKKVKFATHNARLFSIDEKLPIYEKPTWKKPFTEKHCLVPMTHFIEPIYGGEFAGNMVAFSERNEKLFFAAGIWETWADKNELIESFAILTDDPIEFVEKTGHERSPIFVQESFFKEWLEAEHKPAEWIELLRKNRVNLDLKVEIDRPLAKGWEKKKITVT